MSHQAWRPRCGLRRRALPGALLAAGVLLASQMLLPEGLPWVPGIANKPVGICTNTAETGACAEGQEKGAGTQPAPGRSAATGPSPPAPGRGRRAAVGGCLFALGAILVAWAGCPGAGRALVQGV